MSPVCATIGPWPCCKGRWPSLCVRRDRSAPCDRRGQVQLQFRPGSQYAYCNQNFRLLSDILEDHMGRAFADLLRESVFAPGGNG
ncbi:serine hydrolase [Caulobacter segnis]